MHELLAFLDTLCLYPKGSFPGDLDKTLKQFVPFAHSSSHATTARISHKRNSSRHYFSAKDIFAFSNVAHQQQQDKGRYTCLILIPIYPASLQDPSTAHNSQSIAQLIKHKATKLFKQHKLPRFFDHTVCIVPSIEPRAKNIWYKAISLKRLEVF
ncbi:hypothetical protein I312_104646 [Cryptococcus bacillisporus CA1280]|uniref:uncharacterized protein n=1 Tax=Cryptococcus bacillisporus CA1280 TaxID=1296109 RepID=UPI0033670289